MKCFRRTELYLFGLDDDGPGALTAEGDPDEGHALGQEQVVPLVARQGGAGKPVTQVPSPTPVCIVFVQVKATRFKTTRYSAELITSRCYFDLAALSIPCVLKYRDFSRFGERPLIFPTRVNPGMYVFFDFFSCWNNKN
jgi:hypothetical protein